MCSFYKKRQIYEFIWSRIFKTWNVENMEKQNADSVGVNNPLVLRVKSSSHVCTNCDEALLKKLKQ